MALITDSIRLNRIGSAVIRGVAKDDFPFESDDERDTWDMIAADVAAIRARGGTPVLPNEVA